MTLAAMSGCAQLACTDLADFAKLVSPINQFPGSEMGNQVWLTGLYMLFPSLKAHVPRKQTYPNVLLMKTRTKFPKVLALQPVYRLLNMLLYNRSWDPTKATMTRSSHHYKQLELHHAYCSLETLGDNVMFASLLIAWESVRASYVIRVPLMMIGPGTKLPKLLSGIHSADRDCTDHCPAASKDHQLTHLVCRKYRQYALLLYRQYALLLTVKSKHVASWT